MSEALLQQTQVSRVVERFGEFKQRFPTPAAMVKAGERSVLQAWRGMGYYRRARSLYAAACVITRIHSGRVPRTVVELLTLPGVGRYTAGAVASIAFEQHEPIVDGNVARVLSRLADRRASVHDRLGQAWCWNQATHLVMQAKNAGRMNEGLMELGATVCTPHQPKCSECPLRAKCKSFANQSQDRVPPPKPGLKKTAVVFHALVQIKNGRVGLQQRPTGLWKGLLAPPVIESAKRLPLKVIQHRADPVKVKLEIASFEFLTTHRRVRFVVYEAMFPSTTPMEWIRLKDLGDQAVSSATIQVVDAARGQHRCQADKLQTK